MTLTDFLEYTRNAEMLNAFCKAQQYLSRCEKAHCSISGGADSDVMLDLIIKADTDKKFPTVFITQVLSTRLPKDILII
jgi:3'-phosphoadenosine 5'-phosphosulfate sulfotransferase (PAPS reductase)/FAD synthetase